MKKYRKVAEIIATPPNDTKKVLETLENTGFSVVEDGDYCDGIHYILIEEEKEQNQ